MRFRNAWLLVLAGPSALLGQRASLPQFRLQEEWRIGPTSGVVKEIGSISIAPDGRVILAPRLGSLGSLTALDSTGKTTLWELPLSYRRESELRSVNRMGWTGPTLWVHDRSFDQVAILDAKGKVTKSLEVPPFVRPTLADRHKFPVFGAGDVLALYSDGARLLLPSEPHELVDTPEYDSTLSHIIRVGAGGTIDRSIATFPVDPWVTVRDGRRENRFFPSLANRVLWGVSSDGMRIVMVRAGMAGKDSATIGIVMLNERGDTVFTRRMPYTPERITEKSRDSAVKRIDNFGTARTDVPARFAPFYMPATGVLIGRDRTTWITLRVSATDTATRRRLVLDPKGEPIGTVSTRTNVSLLAADRDHAWAVERDGNNVLGVVRYKLVPKP